MAPLPSETKTKVKEVFESFESSFQDKFEIPLSLELQWLKKAVGRYSLELEPITFDAETLEFDTELKQYVIDTLAGFMHEFYQEREVSRQNKIARIVGKDISIDGNDGLKKYNKEELESIKSNNKYLVQYQKNTALV